MRVSHLVARRIRVGSISPRPSESMMAWRITDSQSTLSFAYSVPGNTTARTTSCTTYAPNVDAITVTVETI